jgi:pilus assembly protein Flp/PilA
MRKIFKAFVRDERGVSALEYAIMAGIVVVALGAVATSFNSSVGTLFTNLFLKITTASSPAS